MKFTPIILTPTGVLVIKGDAVERNYLDAYSPSVLEGRAVEFTHIFHNFSGSFPKARHSPRAKNTLCMKG